MAGGISVPSRRISISAWSTSPITLTTSVNWPGTFVMWVLGRTLMGVLGLSKCLPIWGLLPISRSWGPSWRVVVIRRLTSPPFSTAISWLCSVASGNSRFDWAFCKLRPAAGGSGIGPELPCARRTDPAEPSPRHQPRAPASESLPQVICWSVPFCVNRRGRPLLSSSHR